MRNEIENINPENAELGKEWRNLEDFSEKILFGKFLEEHPNCKDFPIIFNSVLSKIVNNSQIEKAEFTGSMARFAAGFGTIDRFWKGKEGSAKLLKEYKESSGGIIEDPWEKTLTELAEGDLDMDTCLNLSFDKTLLDVHKSIKQKFTSEDNFTETENESANLFSFDIRKKYRVSFAHEPVGTNRGFYKLTVSFSDISEDDIAPIIHLDVSVFPKNGVEAEKQKRHGGETIKSQDFCRLPLKVVDNNVYYKITDEALMALVGLEYLEASGKGVTGVNELALRMVRIKTIHTPNDLTVKVNYLFPNLDQKYLFKIRQKVQNYIFEPYSVSKEKITNLSHKELTLCFNYDPYITLLLLKDTGLYKLYSGLKDFKDKDWHKILLSAQLNLATENGKYVTPDKRSLNSIVNDEKEYMRRGASDGFLMVLRAAFELKNGDKNFNLIEALSYFEPANYEHFNSEKNVGINPTKTIANILKLFGGGLTEVEVQRIYNSLPTVNLNENKFRTELRKIKLLGKVDKQLRKITVWGKSRFVTLYTLRTSKKLTDCSVFDFLSKDIWKNNLGHPYLNRAKKYLQNDVGNPETVNSVLENVFSLLKNFGVSNLESLRSFSRKDFSDIYSEKTDIKQNDFLDACRTLQIISEDALRYPQFNKRN